MCDTCDEYPLIFNTDRSTYIGGRGGAFKIRGERIRWLAGVWFPQRPAIFPLQFYLTIHLKTTPLGWTSLYTYISICVCIYTCICISPAWNSHIYIYMCVCVRVHIHVCVYPSNTPHTHTHNHSHTSWNKMFLFVSCFTWGPLC